MSSTSSPISERLNLSPLRMGLGVSNNNKQWIPVSWESSMGGPLGEVLNNSPSALSLMTDGWESSQQMPLSPTGVLQKTAFGSLSNSSTGSNPRTGSTTLITSSMPLFMVIAHLGWCCKEDRINDTYHFLHGSTTLITAKKTLFDHEQDQ
ncbi:hypothetical protein L6452_06589 [Arctium lappa]|uniref:Uncharacterized protein n=1 Tax=Arctium lappa TaxID=4217 RepID=A0ACB9EJY7_ARCLA|nr:hypothetical protein L6452_06589 [Arctium lappa]